MSSCIYYSSIHCAVAWTIYAIVECCFTYIRPWLLKPGYAYKPLHWRFTVILFVLIFLLSDVEAVDESVATLDLSTFLSSDHSTGYTSSREVVFDSSGNIIVPFYGAIDPSHYPSQLVRKYGPVNPSSTIAVAKLDSSGSRLLWITFLGGAKHKGLYGIEIDQNDSIYCSGATWASDYPTTSGAWDRMFNGGTQDAFVFKLSLRGELIYSTFLGGSKRDSARGGLVVDSQGAACVVGVTESPDFLSSGNIIKYNFWSGPVGDGFITKLSPDGSSVEWVRFIGGSGKSEIHGDVIVGARLDSHEYIYCSALVRSSTGFFANTPGWSTFNGGDSDLYLFKLSPDGSKFVYATVFGGSGGDWGEHRMALDSNNNVYVTATVNSSDIPVINGSEGYGGLEDGLLVKFNQNGVPVFSTYIGGSRDDAAFGPAVDGEGNIYVTGFTMSSDFITTFDALDNIHNGARDVYFRIYAPDGSVYYSTFIGGSKDDYGRYITLDKQSRPVLVGQVDSHNFPTTPGAYDTIQNGGNDVFLTRIILSQ
ncbi:MAG: SBBP repeat-containing protein [Planctomycetota bacterium]